MKKLVDEVVNEVAGEKTAASPAANYLFKVNPDCTKLDRVKRERFHSLVAKLLYLAKRGRPDILTAVSFLTTRVLCADEDDWKKLERVVAYLRGTADMVLKLEGEDLSEIHAYVDASHAVHPDAKSQTGVTITLGRGAVLCKSSKQKLVAKSSTVAELVALSEGLDYVMWIKQFLKAQGFDMKEVVIHQDNKSTIFLAEKGKAINQKTRYIDIRYFSITDLIEKKEIRIEYTKTEDMIADYFTKPLQGNLFCDLRNRIVNAEVKENTKHARFAQVSVGENGTRKSENPKI
jgi:hypothetical protein